MTALALGVPLTVVSVLGLLLNGYILLIVVLTKQVQTANNLLLLHLGVVDSLLCVAFLLFSAPNLLRSTGGGAGPGGATGTAAGALCAVHGFLFTLLHPVALWTVCGLNCDRYYAISAPLHYTNLVNTRKVVVWLGASWLVALGMAVPPLFLNGAGYRYLEHGGAGCAPHFTGPSLQVPIAAIWYSGVYTTVTLLVPAALILGCNLKVLMIARYHRHRIASAIYEVTLSAQVTITHQRNPFYLQSQMRGRSAVYTVLQLLGSLLVLYFPYYGVITWEAGAAAMHSAPTHVHPHVVAVASALLACSPPVNGFIYGVKSKVLRKTFANFLRKQITKSEVNNEIQARTPSACGSRRPSLTPLGLLGRPGIPPPARRLSDVLLEPGSRFAVPAGCSPLRPRLLKRMATELSWRPALLAAATSVDLNTKLRRSRSVREELRREASCNTLQVPGGDEISPQQENSGIQLNVPPRTAQYGSPLRPSASAACLLVQRVLLAPRSKKSRPPSLHSPQILITRAHSEDSSGSHNAIPALDPATSSTTALLPDSPVSTPSEELPPLTQDRLHLVQRVCVSLDDIRRPLSPIEHHPGLETTAEVAQPIVVTTKIRPGSAPCRPTVLFGPETINKFKRSRPIPESFSQQSNCELINNECHVNRLTNLSPS